MVFRVDIFPEIDSTCEGVITALSTTLLLFLDNCLFSCKLNPILRLYLVLWHSMLFFGNLYVCYSFFYCFTKLRSIDPSYHSRCLRELSILLYISIWVSFFFANKFLQTLLNSCFFRIYQIEFHL